jgi:hypothetical protein
MFMVNPFRFGGASSPTVALLHFDGSGTTFTDATGKTCTAFGSATQSTTQSVFGGKALDLTGGAGRVEIADSTDFDFGTGPFVIEWREYRTANTDYQNAFSRGYNVAGGMFMQSSSPGSSDRTLYFVNSSGTPVAVCGFSGQALNTWAAWRVQRTVTGLVQVSMDGVQAGSGSSSINLGLRAPFVIGADSASSYWTRGYIDEFRVRKGESDSTASYTPATSPFTYP